MGDTATPGYQSASHLISVTKIQFLEFPMTEEYTKFNPKLNDTF